VNFLLIAHGHVMYVIFLNFMLSVLLPVSVGLFTDVGMTHVLPWLSLTVSSVGSVVQHPTVPSGSAEV
jgi:hypothetical protein